MTKTANFTLLPWLDPHWQQLAGCVQQERIPQALLISGKAGLGKRQLVDLYAQALLCDAPQKNAFPCGGCHSCTLIAADTHPDRIVIQPDEPGKMLGIEIIRQLVSQLTLKPQFDSNRIVIIHLAEDLNNAAANAFLKYLEEPTIRTSVVLISENPGKLPATVRSRCQKIVVKPPEKTKAINWLRRQKIEECEILLKLAQGSPLLAREYAEKDYLSIYREYFKDWLKLADGRLDSIRLAEQWFQQEKVTLAVLLVWMIEWVMTLFKLSQNIETQNESQPDLQPLLEGLNLYQLYQFYDLLLLSRQQLDSQLNKQLLIERILIEWSRLNKR